MVLSLTVVCLGGRHTVGRILRSLGRLVGEKVIAFAIE
jgi:hypothetical protein